MGHDPLRLDILAHLQPLDIIEQSLDTILDTPLVYTQ